MVSAMPCIARPARGLLAVSAETFVVSFGSCREIAGQPSFLMGIVKVVSRSNSGGEAGTAREDFFLHWYSRNHNKSCLHDYPSSSSTLVLVPICESIKTAHAVAAGHTWNHLQAAIQTYRARLVEWRLNRGQGCDIAAKYFGDGQIQF